MTSQTSGAKSPRGARSPLFNTSNKMTANNPSPVDPVSKGAEIGGPQEHQEQSVSRDNINKQQGDKNLGESNCSSSNKIVDHNFNSIFTSENSQDRTSNSVNDNRKGSLESSKAQASAATSRTTSPSLTGTTAATTSTATSSNNSASRPTSANSVSVAKFKEKRPEPLKLNTNQEIPLDLSVKSAGNLPSGASGNIFNIPAIGGTLRADPSTFVSALVSSIPGNSTSTSTTQSSNTALETPRIIWQDTEAFVMKPRMSTTSANSTSQKIRLSSLVGDSPLITPNASHIELWPSTSARSIDNVTLPLSAGSIGGAFFGLNSAKQFYNHRPFGQGQKSQVSTNESASSLLHSALASAQLSGKRHHPPAQRWFQENFNAAAAAALIFASTPNKDRSGPSNAVEGYFDTIARRSCSTEDLNSPTGGENQRAGFSTQQNQLHNKRNSPSISKPSIFNQLHQATAAQTTKSHQGSSLKSPVLSPSFFAYRSGSTTNSVQLLSNSNGNNTNLSNDNHNTKQYDASSPTLANLSAVLASSGENTSHSSDSSNLSLGPEAKTPTGVTNAATNLYNIHLGSPTCKSLPLGPLAMDYASPSSNSLSTSSSFNNNNHGQDKQLAFNMQQAIRQQQQQLQPHQQPQINSNGQTCPSQMGVTSQIATTTTATTATTTGNCSLAPPSTNLNTPILVSPSHLKNGSICYLPSPTLSPLMYDLPSPLVMFGLATPFSAASTSASTSAAAQNGSTIAPTTAATLAATSTVTSVPTIATATTMQFAFASGEPLRHQSSGLSGLPGAADVKTVTATSDVEIQSMDLAESGTFNHREALNMASSDDSVSMASNAENISGNNGLNERVEGPITDLAPSDSQLVQLVTTACKKLGDAGIASEVDYGDSNANDGCDDDVDDCASDDEDDDGECGDEMDVEISKELENNNFTTAKQRSTINTTLKILISASDSDQEQSQLVTCDDEWTVARPNDSELNEPIIDSRCEDQGFLAQTSERALSPKSFRAQVKLYHHARLESSSAPPEVNQATTCARPKLKTVSDETSQTQLGHSESSGTHPIFDSLPRPISSLPASGSQSTGVLTQTTSNGCGGRLAASHLTKTNLSCRQLSAPYPPNLQTSSNASNRVRSSVGDHHFLNASSSSGNLLHNNISNGMSIKARPSSAEPLWSMQQLTSSQGSKFVNVNHIDSSQTMLSSHPELSRLQQNFESVQCSKSGPTQSEQQPQQQQLQPQQQQLQPQHVHNHSHQTSQTSQFKQEDQSRASIFPRTNNGNPISNGSQGLSHSAQHLNIEPGDRLHLNKSTVLLQSQQQQRQHLSQLQLNQQQQNLVHNNVHSSLSACDLYAKTSFSSSYSQVNYGSNPINSVAGCFNPPTSRVEGHYPNVVGIQNHQQQLSLGSQVGLSHKSPSLRQQQIHVQQQQQVSNQFGQPSLAPLTSDDYNTASDADSRLQFPLQQQQQHSSISQVAVHLNQSQNLLHVNNSHHHHHHHHYHHHIHRNHEHSEQYHSQQRAISAGPLRSISVSNLTTNRPIDSQIGSLLGNASDLHFRSSSAAPIGSARLSQVNQRHQQQHTARKYHCDKCSKKFARSDMLARHKRLHNGDKPFRCEKCQQEFSRTDHLSTHMRTHTGEKPYKCKLCDYSACRRDMITRHMKVHNRTSSGGFVDLAIG